MNFLHFGKTVVQSISREVIEDSRVLNLIGQTKWSRKEVTSQTIFREFNDYSKYLYTTLIPEQRILILTCELRQQLYCVLH